MRTGFVGLLMNEFMKIFRRPSTSIYAAILLLVVVTVAIVSQQLTITVDDGQWQAKAEAQLLENNKNLQDIAQVPAVFRETVRESLEASNILLQYELDHGINPYDNNSWDFVTGAAVEIIPLVAVFTVIIASQAVASDFSAGTIKLLLIRPHHRWSILLAKYVAVACYALLLLCLLFVFAWLSGNFLFGYGSFHDVNLIVSHGQVEPLTTSIIALKTLGLEWISLLMIMSLTFMLAVVLRSNALAIAIGIFTGYVVSLDMVLAQLNLTKYLFVTNLDLSYYLYHAEGKIAGTTFSFSMIVNVVYWLLFVTIAWWVYQRRDVA